MYDLQTIKQLQTNKQTETIGFKYSIPKEEYIALKDYINATTQKAVHKIALKVLQYRKAQGKKVYVAVMKRNINKINYKTQQQQQIKQ